MVAKMTNTTISTVAVCAAAADPNSKGAAKKGWLLALLITLLLFIRAKLPIIWT